MKRQNENTNFISKGLSVAALFAEKKSVGVGPVTNVRQVDWPLPQEMYNNLRVLTEEFRKTDSRVKDASVFDVAVVCLDAGMQLFQQQVIDRHKVIVEPPKVVLA